jgi:hypothetical protein
VDITEFITARLDEAAADAGSYVVWQLDHEGYGSSLHATADHAKAQAERREASGSTYWRWDESYRLKRDGETIATIQRVQVLGADPARVLAEISAKREILLLHPSEIIGGDDWERGAYVSCKTCDGEPYPCQTLKLMARPYAGHSHYHQVKLGY